MRGEKDFSSTISQLIEATSERKEGYKKAAEAVKHSDLYPLFERYAYQSESFHEELVQFAREYGKCNEFDGCDLIHFKDILANVLDHDNESELIHACLDAENAVIKNYEEAMEDGLPMELRSIVNRQYNEIRKAIDSIKSKE
jgi:uncharacterized protein (TIGR02284 family)